MCSKARNVIYRGYLAGAKTYNGKSKANITAVVVKTWLTTDHQWRRLKGHTHIHTRCEWEMHWHHQIFNDFHFLPALGCSSPKPLVILSNVTFIPWCYLLVGETITYLTHIHSPLLFQSQYPNFIWGKQWASSSASRADQWDMQKLSCGSFWGNSLKIKNLTRRAVPSLSPCLTDMIAGILQPFCDHGTLESIC